MEAKHLLLLDPDNQILNVEMLSTNRRLLIISKKVKKNLVAALFPACMYCTLSEINVKAKLYKHHPKVQGQESINLEDIKT